MTAPSKGIVPGQGHASTIPPPPARRPASWPRRGVFKVAPDGPWFVPSRSTPGDFHKVTWDTNRLGIFFGCSCRAGRERGHMGQHAEPPCWHVREVSLAEQEDGYTARPAGIIGDTGRFVD